MTVGDEVPFAMTLLAYEQLTEHGLALPLFGTSTSANALHVAMPSIPGDPAAHIRDFQVYPATAAIALDASLHRAAASGAIWIDVFVWDGVVHVGTRAELWESTRSKHGVIEHVAPLTLFALAEGAGRVEIARCAALVHEWLAQDWGTERADRWRLHSYLARLARRDLTRYFGELSMVSTASTVMQTMLLVQREAILELRSPRVGGFRADDLPNLAFAADALGWRLEVAVNPAEQATESARSAETTRAMVMRLRHGRGHTQTQIPLRVFDAFFRGKRNVRDTRTGRTRSMTLSKAHGVRNTMKLQLPEIADMSDPVARFERRPDGVVYEVHDAGSPEGRLIAELLEEGLRDGSTLKTLGGMTWWRVLP